MLEDSNMKLNKMDPSAEMDAAADVKVLLTKVFYVGLLSLYRILYIHTIHTHIIYTDWQCDSNIE